MPLNLHTKIDIDGMKHSFIADITSPYLILNISKGEYEQDKKLAKAFYILDVKDLGQMEDLLGYRYSGPFYAMGEILYRDHLMISGLSKSYGGMLDFLFEKDGLKVELYDVSFMDFMKIFPFTPMLKADTTGHIYYNFIQKTLVVNTTLDNARFLPSKLVDTVYEKSGINMLNETFNTSSLDATYHNGMLTGNLKLTNPASYLYLTSTQINTEENTIDSYFDIKMQKQEFTGKVYGSLNDPKVNLNMQKLIQYQMDKQLDSMLGKGNREMIENMPMGGVAKGVATGAAATFMGMFF